MNNDHYSLLHSEICGYFFSATRIVMAKFYVIALVCTVIIHFCVALPSLRERIRFDQEVGFYNVESNGGISKQFFGNSIWINP